MATESITDVTVFLDLQTAFDVANRTVILDHLSKLGINGKILTWVKSYLSERYSKVFYKGYITDTKKLMELGTPQGGVLSPFLFNVLMDKLLADIKLKPSDTVICYADDICFRSGTITDMQALLDQFCKAAEDCGLIISIPKTKCLLKKDKHHNLRLGNNVITTCTEYQYLGIPIPLPRDYIKQLCINLRKRLKPLRVLAGNVAGANVKICRTFYLAYVRSVVDYHALHLCSRTAGELKKLETIQNEALRIILGCPISTRVVNMQTELNLTSLADHIKKVATLYGLKLIQNGTRNEFYDLLYSDNAQTQPLILPKCIKVIQSEINKLNVHIQPHDDGGIIPNPPWKIVNANIKIPSFYPEQNKHNTLPQNLKFQTLKFIDDELNAYPNPQTVSVIYTDGSFMSSTGKSGCAYVVYKEGKLKEKWAAPLPKWSSSTNCELNSIEKAVAYSLTVGDSLIITDSMSALCAIKSKSPLFVNLINKIDKNLYTAYVNNIKIKFLWIPSHINVSGNEEADRTAKQITIQQCVNDTVFTVRQLKTLLLTEHRESVQLRTNTQRRESISIKHYDHFSGVKHFYGKAKLFGGPCDRIAARIRLGYRRVWQIDKDKTGRSHPEYSKCTLCQAPDSNTLEHYVSYCSSLSNFRPPDLRYIELCYHFCKPEVLYPILRLYPNFKM